MADYLIKDTTLTGIADKVRTVTGSTGTMTPATMQSNLQTFDNDMTSTVNEQDDLITQIASALEGKVVPPSVPSGPSVETCKVTITKTAGLGGALVTIGYINKNLEYDVFEKDMSRGDQYEIEVVKPSLMVLGGSNSSNVGSDNLYEFSYEYYTPYFVRGDAILDVG